MLCCYIATYYSCCRRMFAAARTVVEFLSCYCLLMRNLAELARCCFRLRRALRDAWLALLVLRTVPLLRFEVIGAPAVV